MTEAINTTDNRNSPSEIRGQTAADGDGSHSGDLEKLREEIRDLKIERLLALADGDEGEEKENEKTFEALADEIEVEWPDHLPLWTARLARADTEDGTGDTGDILAANPVIHEGMRALLGRNSYRRGGDSTGGGTQGAK